MPRTLYVLSYEYVDDIEQRRTPFRDGHLAHIAAAHEAGRIVLAGALGDPVSGGLLVFDVSDPAEVEAFAEADPYVRNELVVSRRVQPLAAVAG